METARKVSKKVTVRTLLVPKLRKFPLKEARQNTALFGLGLNETVVFQILLQFGRLSRRSHLHQAAVELVTDSSITGKQFPAFTS